MAYLDIQIDNNDIFPECTPYLYITFLTVLLIITTFNPGGK